MTLTLKDRRRLAFLAVLLFFFFVLLIYRFYQIQIIEGDHWTKIANAQHQIIIDQPARRGIFYANSGLKQGHPSFLQPLITDVPKFHLYIDALSVPEEDKDALVQSISSILKLSPKVEKKLRLQCDKKTRSRCLVRWLDKSDQQRIESWWGEFARERRIVKNGIYFVQDYLRSYPFGSLLGQVLHTVRKERGEAIPTGGLETMLHHYLAGISGKKRLLRSPKHPMETGETLSFPENGADVYLTIDLCIQAIAEEEIAKTVKIANAKGGWAVMMHPRTGEILALAQYPFFSPERFNDYFNDPELKEHTKVKAITDPYEPGSTFKPITLALCLKANEELKKQGKPPLFSPAEKIETSNGKFPGRSKLLKDTRTHHYLNMNLAVQKSSDVYMARLIERLINSLGAKWYRDNLQALFGFGVKTGIELPSETAGMVPTPGKRYPSGAPEWSGPTPYSLSFGYNILTTSVQMLKAHALFANGGYEVTPTIIRKIIKKTKEGKEEILLDNTGPDRVKKFKHLLDPKIIREVVNAMKYATKPGGTATRADIYGYTEAGKTGTTEKLKNGVYSKSDHFSTFIGFAPLSDPQFVLIVALDEPEKRYLPGLGKVHHGGGWGAPAFREIATRTLHYLGIEPDDPYGYPPGDPRYDPEKADWVKECRALKELYQQWNGS